MTIIFGTVPDWPECRESIEYVVELYLAKDGRAHGSLAAVVYICPAHLEQARAGAWLQGPVMPYTRPGRPISPRRCGYLVDYRETQDVEAPTQDVGEERAEKGCTHPPDEPCFGKPRRPVAEYNPPITADPEGWDPEDPYGHVAEYEREAGRDD